MAVITLPTAEYLRQCFVYDPENGILTWRSRPRGDFGSDRMWHTWLTRFSGKPAGCPMSPRGYLVVRIDGRRYLTHRLVWKIMTGEDPVHEIDHIDRNTSDNRWANLRAATSGQNKYNMKAHGAVPAKGVCRARGRYLARAQDNNSKQVHLGYFTTAEAAHAAYVRFIQSLRGDFYHPD